MKAIETEAIREGMIPLRRDGIEKALAGKTTLEEIRRGLYGDV